MTPREEAKITKKMGETCPSRVGLRQHLVKMYHLCVCKSTGTAHRKAFYASVRKNCMQTSYKAPSNYDAIHQLTPRTSLGACWIWPQAPIRCIAFGTLGSLSTPG
jgi:hypothetical protein